MMSHDIVYSESPTEDYSTATVDEEIAEAMRELATYQSPVKIEDKSMLNCITILLIRKIIILLTRKKELDFFLFRKMYIHK